MKENQWPYPDIEKAELSARIASVEKILQKYGAEYMPVDREGWRLSL